MAPYVLPIRSGVVDACVEVALFLVSLVLCMHPLEQTRALCVEKKLRRGGVIPLHRRCLTSTERIVSLLILVGLPIIALTTFLGRNGETVPEFKTVPALVDVWDTDILGLVDGNDPSILNDTWSSSVLRCGTGDSGLSPQEAIVTRDNGTVGKVYCPGKFKHFIDGFVQTEPVVETPPPSLYPTTDAERIERQFGELASVGDWRSQCIFTQFVYPETKHCHTWKWTVDYFTVCPSHTRASIPATCTTLKLADGAPKIDTNKAAEKVALGSRNGAGTALLVAHFTVSKLKVMDVEVDVGTRQVTVITTWSWFGVLVVISVSSLAALAVSVQAQRMGGFSMPLCSYAGMASYAASLEDSYAYSESSSKAEGSEVGEGTPQISLRRAHIRLVEGNDEFAGLVSIGRNPAANGFTVQAGRIRTRFSSVNGPEFAADSNDSKLTLSDASLNHAGLET